jgi:N-acetylmuramoyl-L-alanine amidase
LANALDAEAFVSIHHNTPAAVASDGPGTEVYVQASQPESGRLGALIYENVTARLDRFDVEWVARSDAGVLVVLNDADEDAFGINRRSAVPAALVELAYIGNPEEAVLMASDEYVTTAAQAVALGIEQFLTTDEPGTGYVAASRRFNPSGETGGDSGCTDPPLG